MQIFKNRKNLEINKYFSNKLKSKGNFEYFKKKSFEIHDRLSFGGNTNIWGGFINIEGLSTNILDIFEKNKIKFEKLDQIKNGYKSNINTIRQLRDEKNNILDSSRLIKNILPGLVHSFNIKKNYISIKYFDFKNLKYSFLETKKLLIAISFPQLIDLLFRSGLLIDATDLTLNDYEHDFRLTFNSDLNKNNKSIITLNLFVDHHLIFLQFYRQPKIQLLHLGSLKNLFQHPKHHADQKSHANRIGRPATSQSRPRPSPSHPGTEESHRLHLATLERRHRSPTIHHPHPPHLGRPQPPPSGSQGPANPGSQIHRTRLGPRLLPFPADPSARKMSKLIEHFIRVHR